MTSAQPLAGVRVVEIANNVAGPFASVVLADLGADVVKVEARGRGDDARRMAPVVGSTSAFFTVLNRSKRGVALDLRDGGDRSVLDDLLAEADVAVLNLLPRVQVELGLDASTVCAERPRLIHASIAAYGRDGPERDQPGYDSILQARSGVMAVTGAAGASPVRVGVSILDMGSGLWLASGILAALYERERTGRGGRVDTSLLEVGASFLSYHLAAHQLSGRSEFRAGSEHPAFAPYGVFATGEGLLVIGVGGDSIYRRLVLALGEPASLRQARFVTNADRVQHRDELRAALEAVLAADTADAWIARLRAADVPADLVAQVPDVLTDPQLSANDLWLDVPTASTTVRVPGLPVRFDGRRPPLRWPPPPLDD